MTHPNMKSGSPVLTAVLAHAQFRSSPRADSAVLRAHGAAHATDHRAAANDDVPEKWYQIHNPLWVIVIGKAVLFTVMALAVALS